MKRTKRKRSRYRASEGDPAAEFAAALSLWSAIWKLPRNEAYGLSEAYSGVDQLMREVVRIATLFEDWSCDHVAFEELDEVWPYLLEERFGEACLAFLGPLGMDRFGVADCESVATYLRLPFRAEKREDRTE